MDQIIEKTKQIQSKLQQKTGLKIQPYNFKNILAKELKMDEREILDTLYDYSSEYHNENTVYMNFTGNKETSGRLQFNNYREIEVYWFMGKGFSKTEKFTYKQFNELLKQNYLIVE